jgi:hypothetical protein
MNESELFLSLLIEKSFRNAFIYQRKISKQKAKNMKKKFAILLLAILAVSALSFTAGAYAFPFMSWNTVPNTPSAHQSGLPLHRVSLQQSCVRMDGNITEWATTPKATPVLGMIEAQSRTTVESTTARQGFSATAIWTTNTTRPIAAFRTPENFTYTLYAARLVKGNYSALDFNGYNWFMNGTWNVWKATFNFTIITGTSGIQSVTTTQSFVSLAKEAIGNLTVTSDWSNFNLTIGDIPSLLGTVICYRISVGMFNPFMLSCDTTSNTVTPADLNSIANAYGSMPGWGNYNLRMDPCLDFKVDICDLSTAAANLNSPQ